MTLEWIEKYLSEAEQLVYDNQLKEALTLLNNLLYEEPGYGRLHNHLGWAYLYYGADVTKATLHFEMAIKFDESFAAPYLHMGTLYTRKGKYVEAIGYLEKGLTKSNPNKVAFFEAIGQAYELKGDYAKAIKAFKSAVLASVAEHEITTLTSSIKRCRKKRFVYFFTF